METATLSTNDWFGDLGKLCATTVTTTQPTLFLVSVVGAFFDIQRPLITVSVYR